MNSVLALGRKSLKRRCAIAGAPKRLCAKLMRREKFPLKNHSDVGGRSAICCYFTDPAGSGTPVIWSAFYVHLGLQIGTQFCPDMIYRLPAHRSRRAGESSSSRMQD